MVEGPCAANEAIALAQRWAEVGVRVTLAGAEGAELPTTTVGTLEEGPVARAFLAEMNAKFQVGISSKIDALAAGQAVRAAEFCAQSLAHVSELEPMIDFRIQAGVETPLGFEATLKTRLDPTAVCSK